MHRGTLLALVALIPALALSQGLKISGRVTDAKGDPIVGASVFIQSMSIGTATDADGTYQFTVRQADVRGQEVELTASIIGHKKHVVRITLTGSTLEQDFKLEEDVFQTEEVVVTGIASKTSKALTEVSVSRIPATELTSMVPYQSFSQLIAGKVSGVNVNIASGNVGSGWNFFMRGGGGFNGDGQPLIYVDGVRITNAHMSPYGVGGQTVSTLSILNPEDIEKIEILKGPAAASSYGTSASNGVVLITTKSGRFEQASAKPYTINYQFTFGQNTQRDKMPSDFLFADTANGVFKHPGYIREHSLNISGGTAALRYFVSYQNRYDAGLIPAQNYLDRNSLKASITSVPTDNMSLRVNASYAWEKIRRPPNDNNIYGWIGSFLYTVPAYAITSKPATEAIKDMHSLNAFIGSANGIWKPIPELEITANGGLEFSEYDQDILFPFGFKYNTTLGSRGLYKLLNRRLTYDLNTKYTYRDFLVERLTVVPTIGSQIVSRHAEQLAVNVQEFGSASIFDIGAGLTVTGKADSRVDSREAGIYAYLPFNYDDTFFWTLGVRKDYVSARGARSPSIVYPNASIGVRLDRFEFLPSEIGMLKLRSAYGESGQLPNTTDGLPLMYRTRAGASGSGLAFNFLGNPEIEPERIKEFEVGLDAEFLNTFSVELTYYVSNASKSIVRSAFAPSTGLGSYSFPYNVGSIDAHGFESLLQVNPIRGPVYELSMSLIWNYATTEVKSLGTTSELLGTATALKPGLPKHQYYEYKVFGAKFDANGKYAGVDASSIFEDLGANPIPQHTGSLTANFRFMRDFRFYALADWALGHSALFYSLSASTYMPRLKLQKQLGITISPVYAANGINVPGEPLTVGSPEYIKAANEYAKLNSSYLSNFIRPADILTIREISLSYDFTGLFKSFMPANNVTGVQVGVAVRNALKWTKAPLDPEVNLGGGAPSLTSIEYFTLPQPRTYNAWLRLTF